jgi:hypothetical protein
MVKKTLNRKTAKPTIARRAVYSATGLFLIGAAVAVLGAPMKWHFHL